MNKNESHTAEHVFIFLWLFVCFVIFDVGNNVIRNLF